MTAIDLDRALVDAGRRSVRGRGLPIRFLAGDIRRLHLPERRFDAVLCLWSTFQHMLTADDRARCLAGFHRVLRPGGRIILEMTDAGAPAVAAELRRRGQGPDRRIAAWRIHGATIRCYLHDASTLGPALHDAGFTGIRVRSRQVGSVRRLVGIGHRAG